LSALIDTLVLFLRHNLRKREVTNKTASVPFYTPVEAESVPSHLAADPNLGMTLVSYMVCHAALSHRARVYSRLAFVILMILVEEGDFAGVGVDAAK
jgi:hypothetical protein